MLIKKVIHQRYVLVFLLALLAIISAATILFSSLIKPELAFDGGQAYEYVLFQTRLGPRTIGSEAHSATVTWLQNELRNNDWDVSVQESNRLGVRIQNIVAKQGEGRPWIILGAHYDSRSIADNDLDPTNRSEPVPGANDGASGVAVLLEISRVLPKKPDSQVWLVFFDAEDNGNVQGQDWILGSQEFVDNLDEKPDAALIIDMIGDADLNIYWERNSNEVITKEIWSTASDLGYSDIFIPEYKYKIIDDHIPFLRAGIPAVDIIDFDYPYWHTTEDTPDKVSPESLAIIGNTLLHWLETKGMKYTE
jgi:Zn-dependent M28 family amino/carboxypeptidase